MNYNYIKLFFIIAVILGNFSCEDKTLYRATSDYFPLKSEMIWRYVDLAVNDTSVVKVIGDTSVDFQKCILVTRDVVPEYWIIDKTEIRKFVEFKLSRAGFDFVLEQSFRVYFQLPLIKGNSWRDTLNNSIDVLGDSVNLRHVINGKVESIENVKTPAGDFTEVYKVILVDTLKWDDSLSIQVSCYWLAPETGVVKQRFVSTDTVEQSLIQFISNR